MALRELRETTTPAEHELAVLDAESRLGRKLTAGEQRADIVGQVRDLRNAKALLVTAVQEEQARAVRAWVETGTPIHLKVTDRMREILSDLYDAGTEHAKTELRALGISVGD